MCWRLALSATQQLLLSGSGLLDVVIVPSNIRRDGWRFRMGLPCTTRHVGAVSPGWSQSRSLLWNPSRIPPALGQRDNVIQLSARPRIRKLRSTACAGVAEVSTMPTGATATRV